MIFVHYVTFWQVLEVCDNHLSLYQLTVEPGTPLAKAVTTGTLVICNNGYTFNSRVSNAVILPAVIIICIQVLPEPDIVADMYEAAVHVSFNEDVNIKSLSSILL